MHPWHQVKHYSEFPDIIPAIIEVPKGSQVKYELDKETGLIILDRVLYTSTHYPMNYGFIPHTLSGDNDPLDVFVLCSEPIEKMSLVRCYPIGVIYMTDRDETDEKIIAIPFGDPHYNGYRDIMSLPAHILDELKHFLTVYKQLEHKEVSIFRVGSCDDAKQTIRENIDEFNRVFEVK